MLNAKAFANAVTIVTLGVYVACRVLSLIAPEFLFQIGKSWFHTFSIDTLKASASLDAGTFIFGAVTLGVITWVTAYAAASLYNKWSR